jgi:hypothetical protein
MSTFLQILVYLTHIRQKFKEELMELWFTILQMLQSTSAASSKFEFILIHVTDTFLCITSTVIALDYDKFAMYYLKLWHSCLTCRHKLMCNKTFSSLHKFHMPIFNASLVTDMKQKAKYRF